MNLHQGGGKGREERGRRRGGGGGGEGEEEGRGRYAQMKRIIPRGSQPTELTLRT